MKGNPQVIANLQKAASAENHLALCYLNYGLILRHFGLKKLASKLKDFGKDARRFRSEMTERILMLGGKAEFKGGDAEHYDDIEEIFQDLLDDEQESLEKYQDFYLQAQQAKDADTRNLFEHWIKAKEHVHIDWLETQLDQIKKLGQGLYIQKHI